MTERVAYLVKRYPRLTETFILNEIRAMERLGQDLCIVSLLPPEPPPHHPSVAEVRAPVHFLPPALFAKGIALWRAHGAVFRAAPFRYGRALGHAVGLALFSLAPYAVAKQFVRGGFAADVCRRAGVSHMHAHFANAPTSVARFASLMTGIPFSFTAHAKDLYLTPPRLLRRSTHAASFVVTCTGYNAHYLCELLGEEAARKVHRVYHGIDLAGLRARGSMRQLRDQPGPKTILSVGRLVEKKGHDDLIEAVARLRDAGHEIRLRIVGEGPLRSELAALIERRGLTACVTLEGAMTHARLLDLYRMADVFALAPRIAANGDRDGIPNVIAEAMAIGLPVVSTDVSGIPELVRQGETGIVVPPSDPAALAEGLASLLAAPERAMRLALHARALLEREFDLWSTTGSLHRLIGCAGCASEPGREAANSRPLLRAEAVQ